MNHRGHQHQNHKQNEQRLLEKILSDMQRLHSYVLRRHPHRCIVDFRVGYAKATPESQFTSSPPCLPASRRTRLASQSELLPRT